MTSDERIRALQSFGYTERQAEFLCLAALHGGYFLRRQYNEFLGQESGGCAERMIEKAIANGHLEPFSSADQTLVYHIGAKPFYQAIDDHENRNRRQRQPFAVRLKLMGLDFVLAHRQHRFLATEAEKVEHFTNVLKIEAKHLPTRVYRSKLKRAVTARYFVDKFPLFLAAAPGACTVPSLCYVDGGLQKPSGFDTYLRQYMALLTCLPQFRLIYVARDERIFPKAERMFYRFFGHGFGQSTEGHDQTSAGRLLEHFRARSLFERRETAGFDKRHLDRLRDDLEEFSAPEYQALYERWKRDGDAAVMGFEDQKKLSSRAVHGVFATFRIAHNYGLFGTLAEAV